MICWSVIINELWGHPTLLPPRHILIFCHVTCALTTVATGMQPATGSRDDIVLHLVVIYNTLSILYYRLNSLNLCFSVSYKHQVLNTKLAPVVHIWSVILPILLKLSSLFVKIILNFVISIDTFRWIIFRGTVTNLQCYCLFLMDTTTLLLVIKQKWRECMIIQTHAVMLRRKCFIYITHTYMIFSFCSCL